MSSIQIDSPRIQELRSQTLKRAEVPKEFMPINIRRIEFNDYMDVWYVCSTDTTSILLTMFQKANGSGLRPSEYMLK